MIEKSTTEDLELYEMTLGRKLGFGIHRDVYVFAPDQTKVIKIATNDDGRKMNLLEDKICDEINSYAEKWQRDSLAHVYKCSSCGKYLLQERTEQLPKDKYPEKIYSFLASDTKYDNFGYIKGRGTVCIDYGCVDILKLQSKRKVKANWWS